MLMVGRAKSIHWVGKRRNGSGRLSHHASSLNPPMARITSASRLYSRSSSPTSDTLMSFSVHARKRGLGGDTLMAMGDAARDDVGDSIRCVVAPGSKSEERCDPGGDPCTSHEDVSAPVHLCQDAIIPSSLHPARSPTGVTVPAC